MRSGVIALTVIEQGAALRHLELQRCRSDDPTEVKALEAILCRIAMERRIELNVGEAVGMLRSLRAQKRKLSDEMMSIEEHVRDYGGVVMQADMWRTLDAEVMLINNVIRQLWNLLLGAI